MKNFIDKIEGVEEGTDINRANLMAMQGFISKQISISSNGKVVTETNSNNEILTTRFNNGTITQVFAGDNKTITKTITIGNGIISEVVS